MIIFEQIKNYSPFNEQEEQDKKMILKLMSDYKDIYSRENIACHMTASAWIVNKDKTKVLMAYHKIYNSFAWLGGHADGEEDLLKVAIKEAKEESGLTEIDCIFDGIYSLEVLQVEGHIKKGNYVSSHLHLNLTYLLSADENAPLKIKEDENSALQWFTLEEALKKSTEPWLVERIYKKLNRKLDNL